MSRDHFARLRARARCHKFIDPLVPSFLISNLFGKYILQVFLLSLHLPACPISSTSPYHRINVSSFKHFFFHFIKHFLIRQLD
jgi:hypothetical protein